MSDDLHHHAARLAESERRAWARAQELDAEARRLNDELRRVWAHAHKLDEGLQAYARLLAKATYHADALAVWDKAAPFMDDPGFLDAYRRGMDSGHHILRPRDSD